MGGKNSKVYLVKTDDPDEDDIRLQVDANVVLEVEFEPDRAYFGTVSNFHKKEKILTLKKRIDAEVKILSVESTSEHVSAEWFEEDSNGTSEIKLRVTVHNTLPVGRFNEKVYVETNLENYKKIMIPVHGRVIGDIYVNPMSLVFKGYQTAFQPTKKFTVKSRSEKTFEIVSVNPSDPRLTVDYTKSQEPGRYDFTAQLNPGDEDYFLSGEIIITTDAEKFAELKLDFFYYDPAKRKDSDSSSESGGCGESY